MRHLRSHLGRLLGWLRGLDGARGQTLAEYSMIITLIAVGTVVVAVFIFRNDLAGAFSSAAGCLDAVC